MSGTAPMTVRRRREREITSRRLPRLLPEVLVCIALLLTIAWTESWPPQPRPAQIRSRLTVEIPQEHRRAIHSWESFFACYGLVDDGIMQPTLQAWLTDTGSIDFPQDGRIEVDLAPLDSRIPVTAEVQALAARIREHRWEYVRQCGAG